MLTKRLMNMTSNFELKIEITSTGGLAATMMIDGKPFGEDCVDLEQLRKRADGHYLELDLLQEIYIIM